MRAAVFDAGYRVHVQLYRISDYPGTDYLPIRHRPVPVPGRAVATAVAKFRSISIEDSRRAPEASSDERSGAGGPAVRSLSYSSAPPRAPTNADNSARRRLAAPRPPAAAPVPPPTPPPPHTYPFPRWPTSARLHRPRRLGPLRPTLS
eukprot:SAG31_NODE_1667_length_7578_cov_4.345233_4_plen_148_part_00